MLETLLLTVNFATATKANVFTQMDPLEQFDVLTVALPLIGDVGFTNLALLLAFNIVVMGS